MHAARRTRSLKAAAVVGVGIASLLSSSLPASAATLTASVSCEGRPAGIICDGYASGGTAPYAFGWNPNFANRWDSATSSTITFGCPSGYTLYVTFTVKDSRGASASSTTRARCGGNA